MYVFWIISEKGKVLSQTTIQHLADEETIYPDVIEWIRDYPDLLEDVLGSEDFGTSLDIYDSFINDNEDGIDKGDPNYQGYQGPPDSYKINKTIDNSNKERVANSFDQ